MKTWMGLTLAAALTFAAALALPARAGAQTVPPLAGLFPYRATIDAPEGLVALPLPADVLLASRGDLADVRVLDAQGEELAYLVDRGDRPLPRDTRRVTYVVPIDAERSTTRSRSAPPRSRETYVIETPSAPPAGTTWVLRVATARARFVSRARVVWIEAPEGEREVAGGAFFRIGTPAREKLELPTSRLGRGRVRVELEGEDGYLEPRFAWVAVRGDAAPATVDLPLAIVATRRDGGHTVLTLDRPAGVVPERVSIRSATASFARRAEVFARDVSAVDAASGRRAIGADTILRVSGVPEAEALSIDVSPPSGGQLEIVIEDGDSPALEALEIVATVRAPRLVFQGDHAAMLRFGGGRVRAPSYDLQRLFGTMVGEELLERRLAGTARLGAIEREPGFVAGPALEFAMRAGATVDARRWSHAAMLTIPETRDGLARVILPADVLSAAREDLADLRVVGDDGAQRGYLLGEGAGSFDVALTVRPLDRGELEAGWSRYALDAPVERLAPRAIELHAPAPFVDREVVVVGHAVVRGGEVRGGEVRGDEEREVELARGWIVRSPADPRALVVRTSGARVRSLELRVRDGDEAPLALEGATARLATRELFVTAPAGQYRMLAGAPSERAPDYEIARARPLVLAVRAGAATIGPAERNPAYVAPGWMERAGSDTVAVWAALLLAVVVLGALTLRVARAEPAPSDPGPTSVPRISGRAAPSNPL